MEDGNSLRGWCERGLLPILGFENERLTVLFTTPNSSTAVRLCLVVSLALMNGQSGIAAQDLESVLYTAWGQLCTVRASGANDHCLSSSGEFDSPSWQPNGAQIVTEFGQHDGPHSLVLLDSRGRSVRRLGNSSDHVRSVWSHDGRYIFAINYNIGSAVARWDATGRNKRTFRVTGGSEGGRAFQMISFSPSGKRAALLTLNFRDIVLATVGETNLTVFANLLQGYSYVSQSVWRDEDHLLFVGKRDTKQGELWELTISDGSVRKCGIEGLWLRDQLAISPDRQSLV